MPRLGRRDWYVVGGVSLAWAALGGGPLARRVGIFVGAVAALAFVAILIKRARSRVGGSA